nr:MAG TPA: hypothetical protein [Caudoviricetes sp.]
MLVLLDWDMNGRGPAVRQEPVADFHATLS